MKSRLFQARLRASKRSLYKYLQIQSVEYALSDIAARRIQAETHAAIAFRTAIADMKESGA